MRSYPGAVVVNLANDKRNWKCTADLARSKLPLLTIHK